MTEQRRTANGQGDALAGDGALRSHQLAELAGTTPRALRHYHQIGVLPEVPRDPNGYRRYTTRDLVRVLRIRQLSASGMPLRKIAAVLEADAARQDEVLAELDRELQQQADRIEIQRRMLARLRTLSAQPARFSTAEPPTKTQQLDQGVWTLITATGAIDAELAVTMLEALQRAPLSDQGASWYDEFEQLEPHSEVTGPEADRLARRIADFAAAVLQTIELGASEETHPVMALVERIQSEEFSPAQQQVWNRFLAIIENRWGRAPQPGHSEPKAPE